MRSGRPRGPGKALKNVGGEAPHRFEGLPGPPGPARPQKRTPKIPARLPSSTQTLTSENPLTALRTRYMIPVLVVAIDSQMCSREHTPDHQNKTGYLKAIWLDFLGAFLRSGRPRGPGQALKMWGAKPPTFLKPFPGPRGRPDVKNAPQKSDQTAFKYPALYVAAVRPAFFIFN